MAIFPMTVNGRLEMMPTVEAVDRRRREALFPSELYDALDEVLIKHHGDGPDEDYEGGLD